MSGIVRSERKVSIELALGQRSLPGRNHARHRVKNLGLPPTANSQEWPSRNLLGGKRGRCPLSGALGPTG
ncbi:hypothetical protein GCM10027187_20420 [Streptosporangium sandarakinum]